MSDSVELEIDGKTVTAKPGSMIIEVADDNDISIPRFCYHKKLSVAANCRMCLVDVENSAKPLPACATPIMPGMKVKTASEKAKSAQQGVMEFLLINHPLDCPICDQGGQCELQDHSMEHGDSVSHYAEAKRAVADENLGPLVQTFMTRCIHCTRCVRFGEEIAGVPQLGTIGRGNKTQIATYVDETLQSEMSGNIIDLCPVGALTSKPFQYRARAWELRAQDSIAGHDCIGSNVQHHVHSKSKAKKVEQEVLRVTPNTNEALNENWISDRDRFSYLAWRHADRADTPKVKRDGVWQDVDWETGLKEAIARIESTVKQHGSDSIAAIASPNATLEELYLLQKIWRGNGCANIDHRLRETDFSDQASRAVMPGMPFSFAELEQADAILLIGSDCRFEQPILGHRVRQASLKGAKVMSIAPKQIDCHFTPEQNLGVGSRNFVPFLAKVIASLEQDFGKELNADVKQWLGDTTPCSDAKAIAATLFSSEKVVAITGALLQSSANAADGRYAVNVLMSLVGGQTAEMTEGANSAGASLVGVLPHRTAGGKSVNKSGLNAAQAFEQELSAYVLLNVEPELDSIYGGVAKRAMQRAQTVVALTPYVSDALLDYADVILPIAVQPENTGTFVNVFGEWQSFAPTLKQPFADAKPAWKVLRVMGNWFNLSGFEFKTIEDVRAEIRTEVQVQENKQEDYSPKQSVQNSVDGDSLAIVTDHPIYRSDNVVRRVEPLQQATPDRQAVCGLHPRTMEALGVVADDVVTVMVGVHSVTLPVQENCHLTSHDVYLPGGFDETGEIALYGETVKITKLV